jgi:hypothetical protein
MMVKEEFEGVRAPESELELKCQVTHPFSNRGAVEGGNRVSG